MYQIRRADLQDSQGIVAVAGQTWRATYASRLPPAVIDQALAQWYDPERIAKQTTNPRAAFYVAVHLTAGIVGFAHLTWRPTPGDAELIRFYVLPDHQGRGLGRQLLRAGIAALEQEHPVRRLFAQVEKENQLGRRAYEGLGFKLVREYEEALFHHTSAMVELCLELPR